MHPKAYQLCNTLLTSLPKNNVYTHNNNVYSNYCTQQELCIVITYQVLCVSTLQMLSNIIQPCVVFICTFNKEEH